uniref:mRNA capping enzyme adenylation domain-containing protein n=1 Tax=viral metagenome TaxID=1070528 RepID=A0A6C0EUY4_9ZZZZ
MEKLIPLFPKINKINYDILHSLSKNTCLFIPKGPKMFAWFTYYNNNCICVFYNPDNNKIFSNYVCFKEELSLGTILYGTLIDNNFVCETIHYYKNESVGINYMNKLNLIKDILKTSIKDSDYQGSISFKLPQMSNNRFILECSNLPYQVYGIVQIQEKPKMYVIHNLLCHFNIKKDYNLEDVYNLHCLNENNENTFYSTALVNDFKTSHFLKKLFYKYKKTYKDIEFSDNEEEENTNDIYVSCLYIQEFKKWKPYVSKQNIMDTIKTIHIKEKKNIAL